MADEALAGLDEGALRKLLEVTADLAERRRIRSAIRELQRQELEREEEALASKRFRAERQDNKENWLHSQQREAEQRAALARLAGQLESMNDVEELTTLLRGAAEYEERKLIRAAIRRVRAQEIEGACGLPSPGLTPALRSAAHGTSQPLTCCLPLPFQLPPWPGGCAAGVPTAAREMTARGGRRHTGWNGVRCRSERNRSSKQRSSSQPQPPLRSSAKM